MEINKYHSNLDSIRFGYKIAKVNNFNNNILNIIFKLKNENYKLIISRVDAAKIELINQLEEQGFLIKDIQTTYKLKLTEIIEYNIINNVQIREAHMNDKEKLCQIAAISFENYGHYAADKNLDISKCKEIYSDWVSHTFDKNNADIIFIAEVDGEIAGFLSHKLHINKDEIKYAAGVIGAIDKKFRNLNIFKAITIAGIQWSIENNCRWVEHNVLITNQAVMRSFIKLGFKHANAEITFHKWL